MERVGQRIPRSGDAPYKQRSPSSNVFRKSEQRVVVSTEGRVLVVAKGIVHDADIDLLRIMDIRLIDPSDNVLAERLSVAMAILDVVHVLDLILSIDKGFHPLLKAEVGTRMKPVRIGHCKESMMKTEMQALANI